MSEQPTPFERFGGAEFFDALVAAFYRRVAVDAVLRPMYPEDDLTGAERRLRMFLEQYWGGPTTYSEERGHPRLRQRHLPFVIGPIERDRWLALMYEAVEEQQMDPNLQVELWSYLVTAAFAMVNAMDTPTPSESNPPTVI